MCHERGIDYAHVYVNHVFPQIFTLWYFALSGIHNPELPHSKELSKTLSTTERSENLAC